MTFEKKRKMAEQPSKYSAVDKALYFLSNHGGKIQEMAEVIEAEVERLQKEVFAPLGDNHHNATACPYCSPDRNDLEQRAEKAEAEVKRLKEQGTTVT